MPQDSIPSEVEMKFEYDLPDLMQLQRKWIGNLKGYAKKKKIRGVYGLFNGGQLVYIGVSEDLYQRIQGHKAFLEEALFTDYVLQEFKNTLRSEILVYEAIYINYYKPPWNKYATGKYLYI